MPTNPYTLPAGNIFYADYSYGTNTSGTGGNVNITAGTDTSNVPYTTTNAWTDSSVWVEPSTQNQYVRYNDNDMRWEVSSNNNDWITINTVNTNQRGYYDGYVGYAVDYSMGAIAVDAVEYITDFYSTPKLVCEKIVKDGELWIPVFNYDIDYKIQRAIGLFVKNKFREDFNKEQLEIAIIEIATAFVQRLQEENKLSYSTGTKRFNWRDEGSK